jgi:DNA-binding NarL/FixJ family response regulator
MTDNQLLSAGITTGVLIVDDHLAIRQGLRLMLSREPGFEVCGDVGTASEALEFIREQAPTVAIVDISLDNESGLDLIRRIKLLGERVEVLAWSSHDDLLYAERALAAGALGFINKREGIKKIGEAVRRISRGEVYLSEKMTKHMISRSVGGRSMPKGSLVETLSNRELEVFKLIGKGITTAEISRILHLSTKTVDTHRQRIKGKLQIDDANKLIREATQWVLENG